MDIEYDGTEDALRADTYEFSLHRRRTSRSSVAEGIPGTYDNIGDGLRRPHDRLDRQSGQDQQRYLDDGTPALDIQLAGTDDTVKDAVDEAKTAGQCSPSC